VEHDGGVTAGVKALLGLDSQSMAWFITLDLPAPLPTLGLAAHSQPAPARPLSAFTRVSSDSSTLCATAWRIVRPATICSQWLCLDSPTGLWELVPMLPGHRAALEQATQSEPVSTCVRCQHGGCPHLMGPGAQPRTITRRSPADGLVLCQDAQANLWRIPNAILLY